MKNKILLFWAIMILVVGCIIVIMTKPTKLGLDLVGGSRLVLEAQTTNTIPKITSDHMDSLKFAIENRINAIGVAETVVQKQGDKRLIIEIPDVSDPEKAKEFLGETAELEFKRPVQNFDGTEGWESTGLTGKDLRKSLVSTNSQNGEWVVSLEFNDVGTKKFAKLTQELVGQPMAIFFNGELQSAPVIQEPIIGGHAQISGGQGGFEYEQAKNMVDLLNAGALPVPAKIIEENTVGPTLGADSIANSKVAGLVGLSFVMVFMIAYYRIPGIIADIALVIYSLIVFSVFKIIPVTLTLAGIAGFILSIGMAVDANILIFERTKEELRMGRTLFTAINLGFDRAFTSIFDSNMSTIITCTILYMLGTNVVKGFALTLAIGTIVSMFSAITVTKNFMHLLFGTGQLKHPGWFGLKAEEINSAYETDETKRENAKFGILD
ncbi:MAG: protein translocase subunit SecD [Candidatus Gastranaerophilales bacterium]|nr:protein translocase subunit SecD [Candidatus Gastranaerophilales bacterium]